jgi:TPR repeat protein
MDITPDVDAALKWAKKSADQEHPLGLYNLAIIYRRGYYDGRDFSKSDELMKKAIPGLKIMAAQGDVRALYNLGFLYTYGICVEKNKKEAVKLLKMAAEKGCLNTEKLIKINEYPEQQPEDQAEDEE